MVIRGGRNPFAVETIVTRDDATSVEVLKPVLPLAKMFTEDVGAEEAIANGLVPCERSSTMNWLVDSAANKFHAVVAGLEFNVIVPLAVAAIGDTNKVPFTWVSPLLIRVLKFGVTLEGLKVNVPPDVPGTA